MVDYYSTLWRAVTAPGAGDAQWRGAVYARAREMLATQMRGRRPPATLREIAAEQAALEAAIARVEADIAPAEVAAAKAPPIAPLKPIAAPLRLTGATWIALAVIVAALAAGAYVFWPSAQKPATMAQQPATTTAQKPATPPPQSVAKPTAATAPTPSRTAEAPQAKDGDLPAGVDGGSSDADLPYYVRRQSVFYRTLQPVGTVIVDKLQNFLYLIRPNNVALRYGIGVGEACADLAGLRRIASMAEWPPWQATPDMIARKLAKPGTYPGGPGNPLGARTLELNDGTSRINGTNAPKTIGTSVQFGCIRLVNDDIVDLYNRVQVGTSVIVGN